MAGVPGKIYDIEGRTWVGPFKVIKNKDRVILLRNDKYFKSKSKSGEIIFHLLTETEAVMKANAGTVDDLAMISLNGTEVTSKEGEWQSLPMWATWIIGFDQRVVPFNSRSFRCELLRHLKSIDFVHDLFPNQNVAFGLIPFGLPGYIDSAEDNGNKSLKLERYLKENDVSVWIPKELSLLGRISAWIEEKTGTSSIRVHPKAVKYEEMIKSYASGRMGAFLLSINEELPAPLLVSSLESTSGSNFLGIKSAIVDGLISTIRQADDPYQASKSYEQLNLFLNSDCALVPLFHVKRLVWRKKCVKGLELSPVSEGYFNYRNVSVECKEKV